MGADVRKIRKYLEVVSSMDEKGKYGLEHEDGSRCDAKSRETCPETRGESLLATEGDKLGGGVSSEPSEPDVSIEVPVAGTLMKSIESMMREKYPQIKKDSAEFVYDDVLTGLFGDLEGEYRGIEIGGVGTDGACTMRYWVPTEVEPGGGTLTRDTDGRWVVAHELQPKWGSEKSDGDLRAFNGESGHNGIVLRRASRASEKEMDPDEMEVRDGRIMVRCEARLESFISDQKAFFAELDRLMARSAELWAD